MPNDAVSQLSSHSPSPVERRRTVRGRFEKPDISTHHAEMGICFRSTQRYTVCGLTPRNLAAYELSTIFFEREGDRGLTLCEEILFMGSPLSRGQITFLRNIGVAPPRIVELLASSV